MCAIQHLLFPFNSNNSSLRYKREVEINTPRSQSECNILHQAANFTKMKYLKFPGKSHIL